MGFDRDFPMSGGQRKALVIGFVVMIGVGIVLFSGFVPGLKPSYSDSGILELNGLDYYYTVVYLSEPFYPANHTGAEFYTFHNVSFALWVTNWYAFQGGIIRGNGTGLNATVYSFALGHSSNPVVNLTTYVSPDREFAVFWQGGAFAGPGVRLMVRE